MGCALSREVEKAYRGENLKEAGRVGQVAGLDEMAGGLVDLKVEAGEVLVGDLLPVDLDSLVDADQVGRGVEAGAVACGGEDAAESGGRGAFTVGSGNQNRGEGGLRVAQGSGEDPHVGEVKLPARGTGR
ncbi:hypothetical protein [Tunturiibacter empetritectus]|uniref:hypothetical protein n=1 Tax=Tunturiibacter empetritectus TaxID=3069691 RepID=UPI003D9BEF52